MGALVEDVAFAAFYVICFPDTRGPLGNPSWLNDHFNDRCQGLGDELLLALPPDSLALDLCEVPTAVKRFMTKAQFRPFLRPADANAECDVSVHIAEFFESSQPVQA